ncbi:MAG: hypothetical protein WB770_02600 [Acidimicrobiales bacterium]
MACQVPPVSQLTNNTQFITTAELAQEAAADLAYELGIALTVGDTIIPLAPFIWAAVAIQEILGLFGGGRPVTQDTDNVIWAYNMSAYEPLHALASDLQEMLKNGAPISDSRPAIQAQFSQLKQGTIESIQQQAGLTPGAGSPGYWQLQQLINTSWAYSANGQQAVLQVVKAIDCFTETLAQIAQSQTTGGGGGSSGGISPTQGPCPPFTELPDCLPQPGAPDQALDEVGQGFAGLAYWLQILAIYAMNLFQKGGAQSVPNGTTTDPVTCTQLTGLFDQLITAIGAIQITFPLAPPTPPVPPTIDLTAIDEDLKAIASALSSGGDTAAAEVKRLADSNDAADALSKSMIEYWTGLGIGDPNVAQLDLV